MKCKNCGAEIPQGSKVCKACGAQVKEPDRTPRYSEKGKARRRLINTISLVAVLLVLAGVIVAIALTAKKAANPAGPETTAVTTAQTAAETTTAAPETTAPETTTAAPETTTAAPETTTAAPETTTAAPETTAAAPETTAAPAAAETQPAASAVSVSLNRTETTASLQHYRELSIREALPADATVSWTSSDPAVVRAEPGRAWGVSVGQATVTATVTYADGQTGSASCLVTVVESQVLPTADYLLPESATRLYTADELASLSTAELKIARNEIYARHGRIFKDAALRTYFESKSWYSGTIEPEDFDYSVMNSIEKQNAFLIRSIEASR